MENSIKRNQFYFAPYDGVDQSDYHVMSRTSDGGGISVVGGLSFSEAESATCFLNTLWNARAGNAVDAAEADQ